MMTFLNTNPTYTTYRKGNVMTHPLHWMIVCLIALSVQLLAGCTGVAPLSTPPAAEEEVAACPEPNPRLEVTSTTINLFVWVQYIPQEIYDCFEAVYGIEINLDEYSNDEEMITKLSAGGANYDLVVPSDYIIDLMIRQELLQPLDPDRLHIMDNFDPAYLDQPFDPGNQYTVPSTAGTESILVNTAAVESVPQSFADLWKPEYAGRIVMLDSPRTVIGLTLLSLGYDPSTQDPAQLEEAKAKLLTLVPNIKLFDSDSPKSALFAGDADLGIAWSAEAAIAAQEEPAIQYIYPSEGAIRWQVNLAIPSVAAHVDATYAFINYLHQPDVFWRALVDYPNTVPNAAALDYAQRYHPDLYDAYTQSPITNAPAAALEQAHFLRDVGDALPLYDQIWTEIKGRN